jgi:DNA-binding transcriptional LysR family regulator
MKLSGFDLNHVRALHFLLEEAHVARAARRLGITPPAASNALARLRRDFGDPLLIRSGRGFVRTALAEELRAPAREMMEAAERLLASAVPFDPPTYEGAFVLAGADRIVDLLAGPLDAALAALAPRATLHLRTLTGPQGGSDVGGLLVVPALTHRLHAEPLFVERYVVVFRRGHPLLDSAWAPEQFAAADHVLVTPRGDSARGVVDDVLQRYGLARRVTRVVTSFRTALALVETSDRVVTVPSSLVAGGRAPEGVVVRPPPIDLPAIHMQAAWGARENEDPRYRWFRGVVRTAVRAAGGMDEREDAGL